MNDRILAAFLNAIEALAAAQTRIAAATERCAAAQERSADAAARIADVHELRTAFDYPVRPAREGEKP